MKSHLNQSQKQMLVTNHELLMLSHSAGLVFTCLSQLPLNTHLSSVLTNLIFLFHLLQFSHIFPVPRKLSCWFSFLTTWQFSPWLKYPTYSRCDGIIGLYFRWQLCDIKTWRRLIIFLWCQPAGWLAGSDVSTSSWFFSPGSVTCCIFCSNAASLSETKYIIYERKAKLPAADSRKRAKGGQRQKTM